jgi:hypothetical protein
VSRACDGEVRPAIEETAEWAVGVANKDVFAAGLRLHRSELRIRQSAAHREQGTSDPRSKHEIGCAHGLHHFRRDKEDAAANDGSDHDRSGVAGSQTLREFQTQPRRG